jgi:hypothetical protein
MSGSKHLSSPMILEIVLIGIILHLVLNAIELIPDVRIVLVIEIVLIILLGIMILLLRKPGILK